MKNIITLFLIVLGFSLQAQYDAETTKNGNWNDATVWTTDPALPGATDDVFIANGDEITILTGENFTVGELWLSNNSILNIVGDLTLDSLHINNRATLNVSGILTINGGVSVSNNGDLTINNTGDVYVDGNFSASNNSSVTVNGSIDITGNLVNNGDFVIGASGVMNVDGSITGAGTVDNTNGGTLTAGSDPNNQISGPVVLPIELISFTAQKNESSVTIYWQTATEENNDFFTIERSADGANYKVIATVQGSGNSFSSLNYSYTDNNPLAGVAYYRLAQTDYNGESEIFDPVSVAFLDENGINIGPSPATNYLNIAVDSELGSNIVNIYNLIGAKVKSVELINSVSTINISDLPRGAYMVILSANSSKIVKRILVE